MPHIFCYLNTAFNSGFNYLLFIPLVAYAIHSVVSRSGCDVLKLLDNFLKLSLMIFILVAAFEIAVKINNYQYFNYIEFIKSYGDMRLDVLRARTLFGSSLSTAAMAIFFSIYFFIFKRSIIFIGLSAMLLLLSGSRTAFMIFIILMLYDILKILRRGRVSVFGVMLVLISSIGVFLVLYLGPVRRIATRSMTVEIDASFLGRSSTTVQTFIDIVSNLPSSFFIGLRAEYVSDSAIASIMAGSGVFAFLVFFFLLMYSLFHIKLKIHDKIVISLIFFLGSLMIGDFFVPAVLFMYVFTFLSYRRTSSTLVSRPRGALV